MSKKKKSHSNQKANVKSHKASPASNNKNVKNNKINKTTPSKGNTAAPMDAKTKKIAWIIGSIFTTVILVIILVSIPWGGDKTIIRRQYDTLQDNNHVYETIKIDSLKESIGNQGTFLLYIGSPRMKEADQFVYEADKVAKEFEIETVYYLNQSKLLEDDYEYLNTISGIDYLNTSDNYFPTLLEIKDGVVLEKSYLYTEDHTHSGEVNYYDLIHQFFVNVYGWME